MAEMKPSDLNSFANQALSNQASTSKASGGAGMSDASTTAAPNVPNTGTAPLPSNGNFLIKYNS